jgi:hypothetical protein
MARQEVSGDADDACDLIFSYPDMIRIGYGKFVLIYTGLNENPNILLQPPVTSFRDNQTLNRIQSARAGFSDSVSLRPKTERVCNLVNRRSLDETP